MKKSKSRSEMKGWANPVAVKDEFERYSGNGIHRTDVMVWWGMREMEEGDIQGSDLED